MRWVWRLFEKSCWWNLLRWISYFIYWWIVYFDWCWWCRRGDWCFKYFKICFSMWWVVNNWCDNFGWILKIYWKRCCFGMLFCLYLSSRINFRRSRRNFKRFVFLLWKILWCRNYRWSFICSGLIIDLLFKWLLIIR